MTRIAVTSQGPTLNDEVDPRFGRAAGFVVAGADGSDLQYVDNGSSQALSQGAGIQAAELIARAGAKVLLTGYVGPKAWRALERAGVAVVQDVQGMTVGQALEAWNSGSLKAAQGPNAEGHR
ncbi:MAG: NifB/NifX family molybdenum-iron cluster-binding protein [Desulfovibrionaceae bacterium]